jgi:hypothetical protein
VGLLEKLHCPNVHLACLQCEPQEFLGVEVDVGECGEEGSLDEGIHLWVGITKLSGVIQVGTDAFYRKEQVILQAGYSCFFSTYTVQRAAGCPERFEGTGSRTYPIFL